MKKFLPVLFVIALFSFNVVPVAASENPAMYLSEYLAEIDRLRGERYQDLAASATTTYTYNTPVQQVNTPTQTTTGVIKTGVVYNTTVRYGQLNNVDVRKMQEFLIARGYLNVAATGNFLSMTKAALKKFQEQYLIPGGDGTIAGPKTNALMTSLNAQ